jgi:chromosome segregation ATPase
VDADAAARHEIERLTAEVERLRALERTLHAERERVRAGYAAEIGRLQDALRAASGEARATREAPNESSRALTEQARHLADRERAVVEREAALAAAQARIAARELELTREGDALTALRARLEGERQRLVEESDRLAEWERAVRSNAPSAPRPVTFREGLARLADPGAQGQAPAEGSW